MCGFYQNVHFSLNCSKILSFLFLITLRIAHLRIAPWWAILSISFIRIAHPNHYVFFRLIWPLGECWGPRLCMPPKYYDVIIIFLRNITIVIFFYFLMFFMSILCMDLRQIPPFFQQKCR